MGLLLAATFAMSSTLVADTPAGQAGGHDKDPGHLTIQRRVGVELEKDEGNDPDYHLYLGSTLRLVASGAIATRLESVAKEQSSHGRPLGGALGLAFDGVELTNLAARLTREADGRIEVAFRLVRNPEDEGNRKAWDALFAQESKYETKPKVSLRVGDDLPQVIEPHPTVSFAVAPPRRIELVIAGGAIALVLLLLGLLLGTDMLRDAEDGHFSLGKTQMAFWGVLVFVTIVCVFLITGTLERIPDQTLALLGISSATGLGALLVRPKTQGVSRTADLRQRLRRLRAVAHQGEKLTPEAKGDLSALEERFSAKQFLRDVCDDGTGPSFHRAQVLVWTAVLGGAFIKIVTKSISLPEFPESLLWLMGVSNATYLSFKFPEKAASDAGTKAASAPTGEKPEATGTAATSTKGAPAATTNT